MEAMALENKLIRIRNARVNNLKDVNLDVEYGALTVFVGPSGSGKSSLAFDVLYTAAASNGSASGVLKFFRKGGDDFEVSGLPARTVGIEQQLYSDGVVENIGYFTGFSVEAKGYIENEKDRALEICPVCQGKGYLKDVDPEHVIKRDDCPVTRGTFTAAVKKLAGLNIDSWRRFCSKYNCDPDLDWSKLDDNIQSRILFDGSEYFDGIVPAIKRYLAHPISDSAIKDIDEEIPFYLRNQACGGCKGKGIPGDWLGEGVQADLDNLVYKGLIKVNSDEYKWLSLLKLDKLNLFDPLYKLSGSEMRNLRLFLSLKGLEKNSLIIIDEPTAGILPTEARKIVELLLDVKKKGHAVVVVEHRHEVITAADKVVAFGPGSGTEGGHIVFQGNPKEYFANDKISKKRHVQYWHPVLRKENRKRSTSGAKYLIGHFSQWHCFKDFKIKIPLEQWTCICGPVNSGKTSYLDAVYAICDKTPVAWQGRSSLLQRKNHESVRRPHMVTPDPIGHHPGSTPATYIGLWDKIRDLFAALPEAKRFKYKKSHFSFNTEQGQCPACKGYGFEKTAYGYVICPVCNGTRYRQEILKCLYHGKSIAEVNNMDVRRALAFFKESDTVCYYLGCLSDLLLEYLVLGQPSNSLSGGESQRVKLTVEMCKKYGNRTLYLLDNPYRGIGDSAVPILGEILRQLTERKNTVIIAENNPEIAKKADWLIFLGERKKNAATILYEGPGSQCPDKFWNMNF